MEMFDVKYLDATTALLKEAFTFKKYKAMSIPCAILSGILVLPFVAFSFILAFFTYIFSFFFEIAKSPLDFLHGIVHKEGQDVKHGTQVIVYLISWPTISFLYVLLSLSLILLSILYALLACFTYIWSFGGFKFHLFIKDAQNIAINVKGNYRALWIVLFVVIGFVLALGLPIFRIIFELIDMDIAFKNITWNLLKEMFKFFFFDTFNWYILFTALWSLIFLCPKPESEVIEKATEENE